MYSVRYNSTKSKMFYCHLILLSGLHIHLTWQCSHRHNHFISEPNFDLSEVQYYQVHLNYLYLHYVSFSHDLHHKYDEHHYEQL